jgi:hypothetical protein
MNGNFLFGKHTRGSAAILLGMALLSDAIAAGARDMYAVQPEQVFEFVSPPAITRDGDRVTVAFETQGFCDVTVAVEDRRRRIVRHLAAGVLGVHAPPPLTAGTRKQQLVWDGKDDQGVYIDDKDDLAIRVSLGLKPRFKKTLYWSPHKRIANNAPLLAAAPEGIYVFEGQGVDHLRLFGHDGTYIRTVYPFPAAKIPDVVGLQMHTFHQDGQKLPMKLGFEQGTLLSSGSSAWGGEGGHAGGFAAVAMAVHPVGDGQSQIALAYHNLNRLMTDGSSGGLPLRGPEVALRVKGRDSDRLVGPTDICFSPDGKTLYLTGYVWKTGPYTGFASAYHVVMRMDYASQEKPEVFLGQMSKRGAADGLFCVPTSVRCDAKGRIYVADYLNNRIQVHAPDGTLLKSLPTPHPALIEIDRASGRIQSFSWPVIGPNSRDMNEYRFNPDSVKPTCDFLGTFEQPTASQPVSAPSVSGAGQGQHVTGGQIFRAAVDFHTAEPTLWLVGRQPTVTVAEANWMGGGGYWKFLGGWAARGVKLFRRSADKWGNTLDFAKVAHDKVLWLDPPQFARSRLAVNPVTGHLYVSEEQTGPGKSFYSVLRIDPPSGAIKEVKLPFDCEDLVFDIEGLAYLKTDHEIVRFDTRSWREVPWDYGERRHGVAFSGKQAHNSPGALAIPGHRPVWYHSSGMWVNPMRQLAVVCNVPPTKTENKEKDRYGRVGKTTAYTPAEYPGRTGTRVIHVWDRHGKIIHADAVPGLTNSDGIGIDGVGDLYVMIGAPRLVDGKPVFDGKTETLVKFKPGAGRLLASQRAPVPLGDAAKPQRPPDLTKYGMGATWIEGAEWMYGGVGYGGQGGSCVCWHARFQLDYFGRSFVPETRRYQIAVLDSAGNLILRIGRYGNVDDGKPLDPEGGPPTPRSIGGDEVALSHAAYVGVHTDRNLYIHDAGNARVLNVELGYRTEMTIPLKP